jgi:hypothetical protein
MLILMSDENEYWKEIFGPLPYYKRLIGINPQLLDKNEFRDAFIKVTATTIGILSISIIYEIYKKSLANDIVDEINKTIIVGAAIIFIAYSVFKKVR